MFFKKINSVHRKCIVFQVLLKTNCYFCWTSFLHSVWVWEPKKWQQPVLDHFDGSEDFFSKLIFLDNGLKSQQGAVQPFWHRITFEGFTLHFSVLNSLQDLINLSSRNKYLSLLSLLSSKAASGYIGRTVQYWLLGNVPTIDRIRHDMNNWGLT